MESKKIRSFDDLGIIAKRAPHVLTLFSGGLDSTYVLKELVDRGCRVTALLVDVGESTPRSDLDDIVSRFGVRFEVADAREEFVNDAVLPAIRAQARYLGIYPISSSLSRPILARNAVRMAELNACDAIVHTANLSQNSLRRLNGAISQLGYGGWFGSPYELSTMTRPDKVDALARIGLPHFEARSVSIDSNLWCREFESGVLDNPEAFAIPDRFFTWTAAREAPVVASRISVSFEAGVPVALDGVRMPPIPLIARLNRQAGAFGIGRFGGLEHLEHGEKVLELREAPAAFLLMDAYRQLETATLSAELVREKLVHEQVWVREAVEGRWFGPLREAEQAFIDSTARCVSGTVTYALRPGAADLRAIKAERPLYLTDRDAWEQQAVRERLLAPLREACRQEMCA